MEREALRAYRKYKKVFGPRKFATEEDERKFIEGFSSISIYSDDTIVLEGYVASIQLMGYMDGFIGDPDIEDVSYDILNSMDEGELKIKCKRAYLKGYEKGLLNKRNISETPNTRNKETIAEQGLDYINYDDEPFML